MKRRAQAKEGRSHGFWEQIQLIEYDAQWPTLFECEANRIRTALGSRALRTENVGSTAVPGLAAEPVIDMILEVDDSAKEPADSPELEGAGHVLRFREPNWHKHWLFGRRIAGEFTRVLARVQ